MIRNINKLNLNIFNFGILIKSTQTEYFKFGICQDRVQKKLEVEDKQFQLIVNEFNNIILHPNYQQVTYVMKPPKEILPLLEQSEKIIKQINVNDYEINEFSRFLIHFGILDLDLWKKFILKLITNINSFNYMSINQSLLNVIKFMSKFRIKQFRSHHIAFEERELNCIINNVQFVNDIIKLKYNEQMGSQTEYLSILIQLNELIHKLGRITNIRYYDYNIFMNQQMNDLEIHQSQFSFDGTLQLANLLSTIHSTNQNLKTQITQCLSSHLKNMKSITQANITQILKIWQVEGKYDVEILKLIKPDIIKHVEDPLELGYNLIAATVYDRDILKSLLQQKPQKVELQDNLKYATNHVFFRVIQIKFKNDPEILRLLNQNETFVKQLNGFCALDSKFRQLETCFKNKYVENVDNNRKSQLEKQIVNQIINICQQNYNKRVQFYKDLKICQFIIDLGIVVDGSIKIAFELEGIVYSYESLKSGKKKLKDLIIKEDGWNVIQLKSSEMKAQQFIDDGFRTEIYGQILEQIENIVKNNSKL